MADLTPGNPSNPPWGPSIPAAPQPPPRCDGEGKTGVRAEGDGGRDESRPDDTGISTGAIDQPPGAARIPGPAVVGIDRGRGVPGPCAGVGSCARSTDLRSGAGGHQRGGA